MENRSTNMTTKTCVYVVKTTGTETPTVYEPDYGLNQVASFVRQDLNYPGVELEWIGIADVIGGVADHPGIGQVRKYETLSAMFVDLVYTLERSGQ